MRVWAFGTVGAVLFACSSSSSSGAGPGADGGAGDVTTTDTGVTGDDGTAPEAASSDDASTGSDTSTAQDTGTVTIVDAGNDAATKLDGGSPADAAKDAPSDAPTCAAVNAGCAVDGDCCNGATCWGGKCTSCLRKGGLNCTSSGGAAPCCNPTDSCSTPMGGLFMQCNACIPDQGTGCQANGDCCSGACNTTSHTCSTSACLQAGATCTNSPTSCCIGLSCIDEGQDSYCTPTNCFAKNVPCQTNASCCSGSCDMNGGSCN